MRGPTPETVISAREQRLLVALDEAEQLERVLAHVGVDRQLDLGALARAARRRR